MEYIKIEDYFLLLVYVILLYTLVFIHSKRYKGTGLRRYFISAFILHIVGTVLYAMVIQYFYGYGDSFGFFEGGKFIQNLISTTGDPFTPFFSSGEDFQKMAMVNSGSDFVLPTGIDVDANLLVMKISALLSYISFNSYLIVSLFFGMFSFFGIWKLFKTFNEILQNKGQRILAIALLYTPSIWFWGGGLIKDSLCLGCIGFIVYFFHKILIKKNFSVKDPIILILLFYFLFSLKSYLAMVILFSITVSFMLFILMQSKKNILKLITASFVLLFTLIVITVNFSSSIESIVEDASKNIEIYKSVYANADTEDDRSKASFEGSSDIGSLSDIIVNTPQAIFTTLFRPFLWEVKKPIMAFSALEAFLGLLATVFVLIKCRIRSFFYFIFTDPYLLFCFIYTMALSIIIGNSTFNFGTLIRYRLPIIPFYLFMLLYIYIKNSDKKLSH